MWSTMDLLRPSAEDPPVDFLHSGAENPPLDLPRHLWIYHFKRRTVFFPLYRGKKFSALRRGESTFGFTALRRKTDFLLYIEGEIFCAQARRIHLWIYRAQVRNWFSSLHRGRKFSALRRGESTFWIFRIQSRNRFSSLYRAIYISAILNYS